MSAIPPTPSSSPTPASPANPGNPTLGIVAGIAAAIGAVALYYALVLYILVNNQLVPLLFIGPIIGGVMRAAGRSGKPAVGWAALIIAIVAVVGAFLFTDAFVWTPYDFRMSVNRLFAIDTLLCSALSVYLARLIAVVQSP